MFSLKNSICVWSSIDRRFFKCINQSSAISVSHFINQSFSVRSRLSHLIVNTYNPTRKMKLVSLGIDSDHIGLTVDYVSAELFDMLSILYIPLLYIWSTRIIQHEKLNWCRQGSIPIILDLLSTMFQLSYPIHCLISVK